MGWIIFIGMLNAPYDRTGNVCTLTLNPAPKVQYFRDADGHIRPHEIRPITSQGRCSDEHCSQCVPRHKDLTGNLCVAGMNTEKREFTLANGKKMYTEKTTTIQGVCADPRCNTCTPQVSDISVER